MIAPLMWSLHIVGSKYSLSNGFLPLSFLIIGSGWRRRCSSRPPCSSSAALMFAVNHIAFVYALKATAAVTVSLAFGLFPITVAVLAAAIGREPMTTQKLVAGAVSFVGVSLVVIGIPRRYLEAVGRALGDPDRAVHPPQLGILVTPDRTPTKNHTPMWINAVVLPATAIAVTVVGFGTLGTRTTKAPPHSPGSASSTRPSARS